jgi:hypothetical protein
MMARLRANNLMLQLREFIFMVFISKDLDGIRLKEDSRNHNLRSCTITSQFFMFLLSLLLLVTQINQVKVEVAKLSKNFRP